jgi:hypothetical protein
MSKSKFFTTVGAVAALAAIVAGSALAGGNAAPKVTGDVTFTNMGQTQHWVFNAQDLGNGAAKGSVLDEWAGTTATSKIISAKVLSPTTATFTTEVTSPGTNPFLQVGDQLHYTVHDGGEGSNGSGDWFTYDGMDRGGVPSPGTGLEYHITSGNIQIHS